MDAIQQIRFDIQPWRQALPNAGGARLTDERIHQIAFQTLVQSGVRRPNDDEANSWLYDPSVVQACLFTTYVYGDKTRKFGGEYCGVHPLRVARRGVDRNRRPGIPSERIITAFERVNHDNIEDVNKSGSLKEIIADREIAMTIILRGFSERPPLWLGNPGLRSVIQRDILDSTDPPGLRGIWRYRDQMQRIRSGSLAPRMIDEIFDDKLDNTRSDRILVDSGVIKDPVDILARAQLARAKAPLVAALPEPITAAEKKAYMREVESLEASAKAAAGEVARSEGNPARTSFFDRFQDIGSPLAHVARALSLL